MSRANSVSAVRRVDADDHRAGERGAAEDEHELGHVLEQHADVLAGLERRGAARRTRPLLRATSTTGLRTAARVLSSSARANSASAIDLRHDGSPSTRSAMMLRWISDAPAEIVLANEWKYCSSHEPCGSSTLCVPSATIAPISTAVTPCSSAATSATFWRNSVANTFINACSGASPPRTNLANPR